MTTALKVFIGSENVSKHSAEYLDEAVIQSTDKQVVRKSIEYIHGLMLNRLGPEELKILSKEYRIPKYYGKTNTRMFPHVNTWIFPVEHKNYPSGSKSFVKNDTR